jgi:hypothetical protein
MAALRQAYDSSITILFLVLLSEFVGSKDQVSVLDLAPESVIKSDASYERGLRL